MSLELGFFPRQVPASEQVLPWLAHSVPSTPPLHTFLLHPLTSPPAHTHPASSLPDGSPVSPPGHTWQRQGRRPWEGVTASEHLPRATASRFGTVPLCRQPGQTQVDTLHCHPYQAGWPAGRLTFLYLWGKVNLSMVFCTAPRVTFPSLSSSCSSSCKEKNVDVNTCVQRRTDTCGKGGGTERCSRMHSHSCLEELV